MGGSASKSKGKAGERECGKILSEYLGGNFQRVWGSGAFVGQSNAYRKQFMSETQIKASKADLIAPDHLPKLVIECKWYKEFPFHALLRQDDIPILDGSSKEGSPNEGWISQIYASIDPGDLWFLCLKINGKDWFLAFDLKLKSEFQLKSYVERKAYIMTDMRTFLADNKEKIIELSS